MHNSFSTYKLSNIKQQWNFKKFILFLLVNIVVVYLVATITIHTIASQPFFSSVTANTTYIPFLQHLINAFLFFGIAFSLLSFLKKNNFKYISTIIGIALFCMVATPVVVIEIIKYKLL